MRWVRPDFTNDANSAAFAVRASASDVRAGDSVCASSEATAMCMAEGNTSFDDCDALTWSLGWTGWSRARLASVATTSLTFMFDEVPEPVWNTSMGNWSAY